MILRPEIRRRRRQAPAPTAAGSVRHVTAAPQTSAPQHPIGRIPVLDVRPCVDNGARPAKCVVDEEFLVTATVFREGHDAVNASVVLTDPDGVEHLLPMTCTNPGLNTWVARVSADRTGWWSYRVEGWSDPYGTWEHDATIKVQADVDTELMLEEGALVLERALSGAWYEIFPRSEGATYDEEEHRWTTGTLRTATRRLPAIAAMGFDVVYLTPIHPIGQAAKKGPNNTLDARPEDPEWFTTRADGTIAYAENPPKKYQDIYPVNFDNDPAGIYAEVRRVVQVWIDHGVTLFRVDNPHTKPVEFWQWLIADVAKDHADVIWLAEAFTKPAMMHTLGKIGFQQGYTYYTWRTTAGELREYLTELSGEAAAYMRPSFWPTTHDILTPYMQFGGPAAWKLRAALAATLVPTYGIYAGYELMEHVARPGAEEQIDNEKYEYKNRRWEDDEPGGAREGRTLAGYLTRLNEIRRSHPALHRLRDIRFHHVDDENFLAFSKRRRLPDGTDDVVLVVANLDPHSTRATTLRLDMM